MLRTRFKPQKPQQGVFDLPDPPRSQPDPHRLLVIHVTDYRRAVCAAADKARAAQPDLLRKSIIGRWQKRLLEHGVLEQFVRLQPDAKATVLENVERAGDDMVRTADMGLFNPPSWTQLLHEKATTHSGLTPDFLRHITSTPSGSASHALLPPPVILRSSSQTTSAPRALLPSVFPNSSGHRRRGPTGQEHALDAEEALSLHELARSHRRLGLRAAARYGIDADAFGRGY